MFSIDFEGIDEYKLRVSELKKNLLNEAQAVTQKATFMMQSEARDNAPVDTGNLVKSIFAAMVSAMQGVVRVLAMYGGFVEFGTVNMRAQPYFSPAFEKVAQWYDGELRKIAARI